MRFVQSVWAWTAIVLTVVLGFVVLVLLTPTLLVDRRRLVVGRAFRFSSVVAAALVPGWRFRVHGPVRRPGPRTVVVGNHRSQTDPFLVSHLPWEMKWLSKASMFKVPFLGWSMRLAGDIPVHRGEAASGRAALDRAAAWIEAGVPVMIFPEGTRSKDENLLPFKPGAFRLAIETGAEVLPIAVSGTETALRKHDWRVGRADAYVMVGRPVSTAGLTLEDVPALTEQVQAQILEMVGHLRRVEAGEALPLPHEARS